MTSGLLRSFLELNSYESRNLTMLKSGAWNIEDPSVVGAYLAADELMGVSKLPRFEYCLEHTHDFVEMVYVCSGQITHMVNGAEVVQRAGELLVLDQCAKHENLPAGEGDLAFNFTLRPQFFGAALDMIGGGSNQLRRFLLDCMQNKSRSGEHLHFKVAEELQVQNLVENLIVAFFNKEHNTHNTDQFTMGLLFLHLFNHMNDARLDAGQDELFSEIMRYIEEHYADGTLSGLAKILYYDACWLSRDIKRMTGSTFTELQQKKRIAQAKTLLATTDIKIAEVARLVGYSNSGFFYQLFQKQVGCSPRNYRK